MSRDPEKISAPTAYRDRPKISVVMGVYNGASQLAATIDSIQSQSFSDFEFIIVNDGSTDATAERLESLARHDSRIVVLDQSNGGLTSALILGCEHAHGEYLARQDIGDVSNPTRFAKQLQFLHEHADVVAVSTGCRRIGPEGEFLGQQIRRLSPQQVTDQFLSDGAGIPHTAAMIRMDAFRKAGGYRPVFRFAQDSDLWYRLCQIGKLAEIPECLFDWAIDVDGISASNAARQTQLALLARQAYEARINRHDEAPILAEAERVSWGAIETMDDANRFDPEAAAEFFIASQLYTLGDARCRRYFRRAIRRQPLWPKAWIKLTLSYLRQPRHSNLKTG